MKFQQVATVLIMSAAAAAVPAGHVHHMHKRAGNGVHSNGGAAGVAYTPYTNEGGCKSADEVARDIESLSEFDVIRLYGTDCDQVASVLKAKADNQKVFLQVYNPSKISEEVKTIKEAIDSHGSWEDVHSVTIGNELVNGGQATVDQVSEYVTSGKKALQEAGYDGKVVAVDTFIAMINNPGLCEISDYAAINAHAYFDGNYAAEKAGEWLLSQIQRVWEACDGKKDVFVTESGWPSKGQSFQKAIPSLDNQKAAVQNIIDHAGNSTILFSAFNDLWKADGSYGVEKYWGIFSS